MVGRQTPRLTITGPEGGRPDDGAMTARRRRDDDRPDSVDRTQSAAVPAIASTVSYSFFFTG